MAGGAAPPLRSQTLSLLRNFLRTAARFKDYNVREYARRRTLDAFRENRSLSDPSSAAASFADGEVQLDVARKQVVLYELYAPHFKSIMEIKHAP